MLQRTKVESKSNFKKRNHNKQQASDTPKKPLMTAEQARRFETLSVPHYAILAAESANKGCNCSPYADWFTYNRWQAQGQQVQKGQKGISLQIWVNSRRIDEKTGEERIDKFPKITSVFCRCQVKPKEGTA